MAVATGAAGFALGVHLSLSGGFNEAANPAPTVAADATMPVGVHLRGPAVNNDGDTFRLSMEETFKIRLWGVGRREQADLYAGP